MLPPKQSPMNPESNPYQTVKSYNHIKHLGYAQCVSKDCGRPVCELSLGKTSGTDGGS